MVVVAKVVVVVGACVDVVVTVEIDKEVSAVLTCDVAFRNIHNNIRNRITHKCLLSRLFMLTAMM